ncbi:glycosyltransferase family 2 protein [Vibrio alginolyticus]|uniref:glycosyltransferase family 2 protein n=1 Tax=Vibrio TaxID=662 RepID=UPI001BD3160B|nr:MULTISPECIES: glycosyltransferase family 2 protein [Vibrio]MBS9942067.1 glycosyltransferase family 2 protein [Vibrio alginolyticus]MDW2058722.1 glycosyltransferase family 2 protein [Vibrio sp. Vb1076]
MSDIYVDRLVSIVMPAYNAQDFICSAVSSVIEQTYPDWELIIVDDSSSDNTVEVLRRFSDSRIKVVESKVNQGPGVSRNIGISKAKGRYLAFLDSDDLWNSDKLQVQIKFMSDNQSAISHTSYLFIDEHGDKRNGSVIASKSIELQDHLRTTEIGTSTAIIDRNIVKEPIVFSTLRARQDLKLWIYLLGLGYVSNGVKEPLVSYRVRPGSVSSNKFKMLYVTFRVYLDVNTLSLYQRLSCYFSYMLNAVSKRV